MIKKLDHHQDSIEDLFKVYYDTLDELRYNYLGQEYSLKNNMDTFEQQIASLMEDVRKYNYIEFYHEQINIQKQIRGIRQNLQSFNIYMPKYQVKIEDMALAIN